MKKKKLDLNLIRVLCAIIETGTITQSAKRLGLQISATSYALNKLRQYYEDPLFFSTGNGMKPTTQAMVLYESFKPALNLLDSNEEDNGIQQKKRTLRVRTDSLVEFWLLNNSAPNFLNNQQISYEMHSIRPANAQRTELLRRKQIDIDIGTPLENDHSILKIPLFDMRPLLVCRQDHPRIGSTISLEEMQQEVYLGWLVSSDSTDTQNILAPIEGVSEYARIYRSRSYSNLLFLAGNSDALMIIPDIFAQLCCKIFGLRIVTPPTASTSIIKFEAHILKSRKNDRDLRYFISLFDDL